MDSATTQKVDLGQSPSPRGELWGKHFTGMRHSRDWQAFGIRPKVRMDARYFANHINHGVHFAVESTGVPQLTAPQVARYLVPVPPEPEQRAIAEALSDVDELLGSLEKLIAKKRAIKQAAMQQLLTGKTRLPGFSGAWEDEAAEGYSRTSPPKCGSGIVWRYVVYAL